MATLSKDQIKNKIEAASLSISEALRELDSWSGKPRYSSERIFFKKYGPILKGLRDCLEIESAMLTSAKRNLDFQSVKDPKRRSQHLIDQYILFEIIDKAARLEKTAIIDDTTWSRAQDVARRSLYLHYRVVNVVAQSPRLERLYRGEVTELRRRLDRHRGPYEIFIAHASADKPIVMRILRDFRARGKAALKTIKQAMEAYPGNAVKIEEVFEREQEKLDALELGTWIDIEQLAAGDNADRFIKQTIGLANTLLVFYTPRYEEGWYLRNKELPNIKRRLTDAQRTKLVKTLSKRITDEGLRAIPVILAPHVWQERRGKEWVQDWKKTVPCPENLTTLEREAKGRRLTPEELIPSVVLSLTGDRLLRQITGGLAQKNPPR